MIGQPFLDALKALQEQITLDRRHCYRMNKSTVPGVTTVIKTMDAPALDAWKVRVQVEGTARAAYLNTPDDQEPEDSYVGRLVSIAKEEWEHERIANAAADIGTQVHALIEHAIREQLGQPSEPPEATDDALFIFAGWREWSEKVGLRPLMSEGRVCWPINQTPPDYAGTFDILATFDRGEFSGPLWILDAKPNARIYPERRMQLAAYARPVRDLAGGVVRGMVVSMPREGGEITPVPVDPTEEDFEAFRACLRLYRWQRQLQKEDRKASEAA